jgi:hypothetical protein
MAVKIAEFSPVPEAAIAEFRVPNEAYSMKWIRSDEVEFRPTDLIPRSRAKHGVSKDGRRHDLAHGVLRDARKGALLRTRVIDVSI